MDITDEAQSQLVIKSLNTEVGLWRLKVNQLQAEKAKDELLKAFYIEGLDKSAVEIEQLQRALKKYGNHTLRCEHRENNYCPTTPCTCGLEQALKEDSKDAKSKTKNNS